MNNLSIKEHKGFMDFSNFENAMKWAELISKSSICPVAYRGKPADIVIAIEIGSTLGLPWFQSLLDIAVVNGRPTLWGDAMLSLCKVSPDFEYVKETFDDEIMTATCEAKRKGEKYPVISRFSLQDAKVAGLLGKDNYQKYPKRMIQVRARAFSLRGAFPHVLKGLKAREEMQDVTPDALNGTEPQTNNVAENIKAKFAAKKEPIPTTIEAEVIDVEIEEEPVIEVNVDEELRLLLEEKEIEESLIQKWTSHGNVDSWEELASEQKIAIIEWIRKNR